MILFNRGKKTDWKLLAKKMLVAYVILQPIFDLYMSLFDEKIQIAGTSLATIARFLMVFVMTTLVALIERKRKITKLFGIYLVLIIAYTIFHHFNAVSFSVELAQADYNMPGEIIYLARMCIPPALLYVIYLLRPQYKDVKNAVIVTSVIISSVVVISNLFEFGYVAYNLDKIPISDNMVSWFTETDSEWVNLTCRGIFQWTNQISGVMLITMPFVTYVCLREEKAYYWGFAALHLIAMMNLGTRIASIGGPLAFVFVIVLHFAEKVIHRESFRGQFGKYAYLVVSLVLVGIFFVHSPIVTRGGETDLFSGFPFNGSATSQTSKDPVSSSGQDPSSTETEEEEEITDRAGMIAYIEKKIPTAWINELYLYQTYPYQEDPEFWYDLIKNVPISQRYDNRDTRGFLINRILERDGRVSNYIWGISYTRSSSFIWPERDIETHFDSLGIVGVLLFICPYFVCFLYGAWHFFRRFFDNTRLSRCIYLISTALGLLNANFSGHIMNEIFPFVYLTLMAGMTVVTAQRLSEEELERTGSALSSEKL